MKKLDIIELDTQDFTELTNQVKNMISHENPMKVSKDIELINKLKNNPKKTFFILNLLLSEIKVRFLL